MQWVVSCEGEEGQVDEVGVDGHSQQQHRQLQQGVQAQEDGAGHHGNDTTQHKDLMVPKGGGNKIHIKHFSKCDCFFV